MSSTPRSQKSTIGETDLPIRETMPRSRPVILRAPSDLTENSVSRQCGITTSATLTNTSNMFWPVCRPTNGMVMRWKQNRRSLTENHTQMSNREVLYTVAESKVRENAQHTPNRLFIVCMFAASATQTNIETFVLLQPDNYASFNSSRAAATCIKTKRNKDPKLM